jgi:hypothetical protein
MATNKCTSVAGHFDGHMDALKQYTQHHPMQHVQGYTRSHWTPPAGNYLLCIAPAAARVTANETTMKTYTNFAGSFDGHGDVPVHYRVHRSMEEVQGFTRSHWTPPLGKYYVQLYKRDIPTPVFIDIFCCQHVKSGTK